ncbi:hypothetical protein RJ639_001769, partial [Escallonia herrerae]
KVDVLESVIHNKMDFEHSRTCLSDSVTSTERRADLLSGSLLPICLSRDVRPCVRSPTGLAPNGGCLLAVCTSDGRIKIYRFPFREFSPEWVVDISESLYTYLANNSLWEIDVPSSELSDGQEVQLGTESACNEDLPVSVLRKEPKRRRNALAIILTKMAGGDGDQVLVGPSDGVRILRMSTRFSRTIYVGNLPLDIKEIEVEDLFYKYGRIIDIELKIPPRPPCYCFVEFESARDAEDAIRGRDGYNFDGCRLRVELAHGGRGQPSSSDRRGSYGGGSGGSYGGSGGGGGGGGGRFGISRHSDYRVIVRGLPHSASWQDLKDHMRKAGDVSFAEICHDRDGTFGLVDYNNYEDMKYAIRKLDDTEFKNPWTRSFIRVEQYESSPSRSRSRSRSLRRNRRYVPHCTLLF